MVKKNKKQTTKHKKPQQYSKRVRIAIVLAVTLLILTSIYLFIRNDSYYAIDRDQAKSDVASTINSLPLSDAAVYSSFRDEGCGSGGVGLKQWTVCSIVVDKYYIADEATVQSKITTIDQILQQAHWYNEYYFSEHPNRTTVNSITEGSALYTSYKNKAYLDIRLEFFKDNDKYINSPAIKKLIENQKLPKPTPGKAIYGIHLSRIYWECAGGVFSGKLPCPTPPSEPRR